MKNARVLSALCAAAAAIAVAGCGDTTTPSPVLFNDSTVTLDVAASAGDAMATTVNTMQTNEQGASLSGTILATSSGANFDVAATPGGRTCLDANGAVVAGCSPMSSVRKIITQVSFSGSRSGTRITGTDTVSWSGAVHRSSNDTLTRIFNTAQPPVETARAHSDLVVVHDTSTFSEPGLTRLEAEVGHDTVKAVTWNLPRSSNPFPVSGSIVRVDSVHVTITKGTVTQTKDVVRTVEIDFPTIDAQGNVVMKVNGKTCNLNLVSHKVSGCQ